MIGWHYFLYFFFAFVCNAKILGIVYVGFFSSFLSVFQKQNDKTLFAQFSSFFTQEARGQDWTY